MFKLIFSSFSSINNPFNQTSLTIRRGQTYFKRMFAQLSRVWVFLKRQGLALAWTINYHTSQLAAHSVHHNLFVCAQWPFRLNLWPPSSAPMFFGLEKTHAHRSDQPATGCSHFPVRSCPSVERLRLFAGAACGGGQGLGCAWLVFHTPVLPTATLLIALISARPITVLDESHSDHPNDYTVLDNSVDGHWAGSMILFLVYNPLELDSFAVWFFWSVSIVWFCARF